MTLRRALRATDRLSWLGPVLVVALVAAFPSLQRPHQQFVRTGELPTWACAGLGVVDGGAPGGGPLVATANYYGDAAIFGLDTESAAHELQRVPPQAGMRMAHDWEVARLDDATTLLIAAGDGHSLVYLLRWPGAPRLPSVQLPCTDDEPNCAQWATAGECERNAGFMHGSCAASCGACAPADDPTSHPLQLVQRLETKGAAAAEHFTHGTRHFLAIATAADATHGVVVYEWSAAEARWALYHRLAVRGVAEFGSCALPNGRTLLGLATWHTGSFTGDSILLEFDPSRAADGGAASAEEGGDEEEGGGRGAAFREMQRIRTHGAHDIECFGLADDHPHAAMPGAAEPPPAPPSLHLAIANACDDASHAVATVVYRYDAARDAFDEVQRLETLGAHDVELMTVGGDGGGGRASGGASGSGGGGGARRAQQLLAVANQGDGRDCDTGSVDVYTYDVAERRFALLQRLRAGCATYAAAFSAPSGKLQLAVAIEREGADERNQSSYRTVSPVFEWR